MRKELPKERLATTDEAGKRVYLYPARVSGIWHRRRLIFQYVLLVIFLILPWLRWNGEPLLLLDVLHRRFTILGTTFRAHEAPMIVLLFLTFVLAIGLLTSIAGRVWCGWACPQTVFTENIYRVIERWIEGDHIARRTLDEGPWNESKVLRKTVKWFFFLCVSLIIGHSFLAYFVGTEALSEMVRSSPSENPGSFSVMALMTFIVAFDFGWFREQFCIIACPYGRFQSVMMDEYSLAILYDRIRGEVRKGYPLESPNQKHGDCVDCRRCVQVCPTGVDIRRGLQLECVACTACVDACDEIMDKTGKPRGLIRYDSLRGMNRQAATVFSKPRNIIYVSLLLVVVTSLAYLLQQRQPLRAEFIRFVGAPYKIEGQSILNQFNLSLDNHLTKPQLVRVALVGSADTRIVFPPNGAIRIEGNADGRYPIFFQSDARTFEAGKKTVKVTVTSDFGYFEEREVSLVGPL